MSAPRTEEAAAAKDSRIDANWECGTLIWRTIREDLMPAAKPVFTKDIFDFFRDLKKHNKKAWMDANRERYQATVCKPFRRLLEEVSPALLKLNANFDVAARGGRNFSRINRDIRFAKDKTPYRAQMYLKAGVPM